MPLSAQRAAHDHIHLPNLDEVCACQGVQVTVLASNDDTLKTGSDRFEELPIYPQHNTRRDADEIDSAYGFSRRRQGVPVGEVRSLRQLGVDLVDRGAEFAELHPGLCLR